MKKRRMRTLAVLLTCTLAMVLPAGCGQKKPIDIYKAGAEKMIGLEELDVSYVIDMKMNMGDAESGEGMDAGVSELTMEMTADMKVEGVNQEDMVMEMDMAMSILGQEVAVTSFYSDGYYYMDANGAKVKYPMSLDEIKKQQEMVGMQTGLKEEDFKELTMEKKDGGYELSFLVPGETMTQYMDSAMGSLAGGLGEANQEMKVEDVRGTISVNKDGYFSDVTMTFPCTMSVMGQEVGLEMTISLENKNPGQDVTVTLPDFSGYEEIDPNALP